MGNKICRARKNVVLERYTRPQRLASQPSNVDYKKLKKLILSEKLAPCFDGADDDSNSDLEECPICFFHYPSLNRSICCMKGICTECFLQMKPSAATLLTQCPFCKCSSYNVEYRGARTQEEKGLAKAEEQKVIEAKIRMQFEESQEAEPNTNLFPVELQTPTSGSGELPNGPSQSLTFKDLGAIQDSRDLDLTLVAGRPEGVGSSVLNAWNQRHAEFGLDLEEIMMMEAIWQSIQDSTLQKSTAQHASGPNGTGRFQIEYCQSNQSLSSLALVGSSRTTSNVDLVTGGIAVAIARMAEKNILQAGTFHSITGNNQSTQTQDENNVEGQRVVSSNIWSEANTHDVAAIGYSEDPDFDDARSENECMPSSTSEDDSWDSFSGCNLERYQDSEDGFISDGDPVVEAIDAESSSCSSSLHSISDVSRGSPNHICDVLNYSQHSGSTITAVRNLKNLFANTS